MNLEPFIILLPLLVLSFLGFFLSGRFRLSEETLVRLLTDCLMPMLVFYSLVTARIESKEMITLAGISTLSVFLLLFLSWVYCRLTGMDIRVFAPPVVFMNSGFLGIPLMELWKGMAAINLIVIYDQVQTFWIFTLGIAIVTGGVSIAGAKEMVTSPLLWAICGGFFFRILGVSLPIPVLEVFRFGGSGASPVAAFLLGCSLSQRKPRITRHVWAGILLRFIGGFFIGFGICSLFKVADPLRSIIVVSSALPSAVFSFVLPLRYGLVSDHPGSVVVLSTLLGILVIPLLFILVEVI